MNWDKEYVKLSSELLKKPRLSAQMNSRLKCMSLLKQKLLKQYEFTSFEMSIYRNAVSERISLDRKLDRLKVFNTSQYETFFNGEYKQRSNLIGYMMQPLKEKQMKINNIAIAFDELECYKAEQRHLKKQKRKEKEDAFLGFISSIDYINAVEESEIEGFVSIHLVNCHFEKYCKEIGLRYRSVNSLIEYGPTITIFRPNSQRMELEKDKLLMDDEGFGWHYKIGTSSCHDENGIHESVMVTCNLQWYANNERGLVGLGFSAN